MVHRRATGVVLVSMLALAKADSALIGVVAPALRAEFHLDDARLGLIASLSSVTGAVCALPAGALVDRRRRTLILSVALVGWSLALGIAGLATGFAALLVARLVSGGIASVARPAAVSIVGDTYEPGRRGAIMGTLDAGQAAGAAGCFVVGALALHFLGWRLAFWVLAAAGVALAVATARMPEAIRRDPIASADSAMSTRAVLIELLRIRTNAVVLIAQAVGNFFYAGVASFAIIFVTERYGISNSKVDAVAPVIGAVAIAGLIVGGRLGDRVARRWGGQARLVVPCVTNLVAAALLVPAIAVHSVAWAGLLLTLAVAALSAGAPCLDAVRLDVVRPAIRGRAEAARGLLTLSSSAIAPMVFGFLAVALGAADDHGAGLGRAFLVMLIPLAASGLILLAGCRHYDRDALAAGTPVKLGTPTMAVIALPAACDDAPSARRIPGETVPPPLAGHR